MISYLRQFKLESGLRLVENYHPFTATHSHLALSPSVLSAMEILVSSRGTKHGSLLYV